MWAILANRLYVADAAGAALETSALSTKCGGRPVTAVINVAGSAFDDRHRNGADGRSQVAYLNARLEDSTDAELPFADVFAFVEEHAVRSPRTFFDPSSPVAAPEDANSVLLVHCRGAHSRSLAIVAALLVHFGGQPLPDALRFIKSMRGLQHINRGFLAQLATLGPSRPQ